MKKHVHKNQPAGRSHGDGKPGYKNVDAKHRWTKGGPSPNPSGRRRKPPPSLTEEMHADLISLLQGMVPTPTGERLTVYQALLRRIIGEALNDAKLGLKAMPLLVDLLRALEPEAANDEKGSVTDEDAEVIEEALARLRKAKGRNHG
jgi:hypothetical protein